MIASKTPHSFTRDMRVRLVQGNHPATGKRLTEKPRTWLLLSDWNPRECLPLVGDLKMKTGRAGYAEVRVTIEFLRRCAVPAVGRRDELELTGARTNA
jgi:hypothetical protein